MEVLNAKSWQKFDYFGREGCGKGVYQTSNYGTAGQGQGPLRGSKSRSRERYLMN